MKKEESTQLKEDQTVYIAAKYLGTSADGESAHVKIQTTDWMDIGLNSVVSISPNVSFEHIVIPSPVKENKPKYDPCRKFREGDIVEPCQVKGRWWSRGWKDLSGIRFTVTEDENEDGLMGVKAPDSIHPQPAEAVFFQLVTPVEELEPYVVEDSIPNAFDICWRETGDNLATYWFNDPPITYTQEEAKAAAETECARLNAEWRKEQNNG